MPPNDAHARAAQHAAPEARPSDAAAASAPNGGAAVRTKPLIMIQPSAGWAGLNLRQLWEFRELLYLLVWRDVKVRYKQTAVGILWTLLQPLLTMGLFAIIFGYLAKLPSDGVPYPLFFYAGLLPWQLFALSLTHASTSLVANQQLITKLYFPRVLIPVAAVLAGVVDFVVALSVLFVFMAWYGHAPTSAIIALPALVVLVVLAAIGVALWLSALNVRYRDVQYALPFVTQFWFFATPIAYATTLVPEAWRPVLALNPMAGVVDAFRWALLDGAPLRTHVVVSLAVIVVLVVTGAAYFARVQRSFADVV
jgi:lipopolysaccharide transport system permease protein